MRMHSNYFVRGAHFVMQANLSSSAEKWWLTVCLGRRRDGLPVPNVELKTSVSLPIRLMDGGCSVNTFRQSNMEAFGSNTGILLRWHPPSFWSFLPRLLFQQPHPFPPAPRAHVGRCELKRSRDGGGDMIPNQNK